VLLVTYRQPNTYYIKTTKKSNNISYKNYQKLKKIKHPQRKKRTFKGAKMLRSVELVSDIQTYRF
jgi:hypothetical protein